MLKLMTSMSCTACVARGDRLDATNEEPVEEDERVRWKWIILKFWLSNKHPASFFFFFNPCLALCFPLQAVRGSGSPWTRPSKCCRVTNPSTPSTCGGSSSAAPRPTETPSSRGRHPTTTTPITAPPRPRPRRVTCWVPPADRTATFFFFFFF